MTAINSSPSISFGPRIRKSPYFEATLKNGARAFTIYNHMYMPTLYTDPVSEYWSLVNDVTLWDVACQRQVEICGLDAFDFIQYLTPRDMSRCDVGQCQYLVLTDDTGGIVNDAVMLRVEEERFWISGGDGDVLLWASGVAANRDMDVSISEPDVSPMQLQGPKSPYVARDIFGDWISDLGYYQLAATELDGIPLVLARTGWSGELGFEFYLRDGHRGTELWERVLDAGTEYGIAPIAPSTIRSVEGGLLSYGSDITRSDDPFVIGLDRFVNLDQPGDFLGRQALERIATNGPQRRLVGVQLPGAPVDGGSNTEFWDVLWAGERIGHVTRCVYSPRLERNIGYVNVPAGRAQIGTELTVVAPEGERPAFVCESPWFPAQKAYPADL